MRVRQYRVADAAACALIFHQGVQIGAAEAYTQKQRDAWSPHVPDTSVWHARLDGLTTWVAEDHDISGFMSLRADGYVDFAFVRPDVMGQGVGMTLYQTLEQHCRILALPRLTTQASHVAKPFFLRQGWLVDRVNTVAKGAVTLENWLMSKALTEIHHD